MSEELFLLLFRWGFDVLLANSQRTKVCSENVFQTFCFGLGDAILNVPKNGTMFSLLNVCQNIVLFKFVILGLF